MLNKQPDILNLLKKIQESTSEDIDEERGSFKKGDRVIYDMFGVGLTNSDLIKTLGVNEHAVRLNHDGCRAEIMEAVGEEVARYSIMFEDGFVINDIAASELKSVDEAVTGDFIDKFKEEYLKQRDNGMERDFAIRNALNIVSRGAFTKLSIRNQKYHFIKFSNYVKNMELNVPESKTNEAEDATDTMKPQEKPDIKAEDFHMEDYSEEDLNKPDAKVKSKSVKTGDAIRQVEDDELEQKSDKVVAPKKESKLKEAKDVLVRITGGEDEGKPGIVKNWVKGLGYQNVYFEGRKKQIGYSYLKVGDKTAREFDKEVEVGESKTNEEETEMPPSRVGLKKVSDKKLKELHNNSLRVFNYWKAEGIPEKASLAADAVEKQEDEMVRRGLISADARSEDVYSRVKENKESKFSFMKKQKPLQLCNECNKTFRSNESVCVHCQSENVERIVLQEGEAELIGLTKNVYEVWYEDKDGNRSSTRVESFDKADAEKEASRPNRKITNIEKVSEGKDKPGKRTGTGPYKGSLQRKKSGDRGKRKQAGEKCPADVSKSKLKVKKASKKDESKLAETVQELVGEVPGIDRIDQHLLNKAIENEVIPNQFPEVEVMIDELSAMDVEGSITKKIGVKDIDDVDLGDIDAVYLKYILLPKAKEASRAARESKTNEMTEEEAEEILGDRTIWELKNMKKALEMLSILNSPEDDKRLEAVKVLLKKGKSKSESKLKEQEELNEVGVGDVVQLTHKKEIGYRIPGFAKGTVKQALSDNSFLVNFEWSISGKGLNQLAKLDIEDIEKIEESILKEQDEMEDWMSFQVKEVDISDVPIEIHSIGADSWVRGWNACRKKVLSVLRGEKKIESKLEEQEDWDLTFQYSHNQIHQNPIRDKEGNPHIWQKHPIKGKRIRVFSDFQAEWVKKNGGIPVQMRGEVEEKTILPQTVVEITKSKVDPTGYNISVVELPEGSSILLDIKSDRDSAVSRGKELAGALNAKFVGIVDESKLKEGRGEEIYQEALEYAKKELVSQIDKGRGYDEFSIRDMLVREFGITENEAEDIIMDAASHGELDLGDEPRFESKLKEQGVKDYSYDRLECLKCGYSIKIPYYSGQVKLCPKCGVQLVPGMSSSKEKQMKKKYGKGYESKLKEEQVEDDFHKGYAYAQLTGEAHLDLRTVLDLIADKISEEFRRGYEQYFRKSLENETKLKEQEKDSFKTVAKGITDKDTADKLAKEKGGQVVSDAEDEKKFAIIVKEE